MRYTTQALQSAMRKTRLNIFEGPENIGAIRYGMEALDALAERVAIETCDTSAERAVFMLNCGMDAHKARARAFGPAAHDYDAGNGGVCRGCGLPREAHPNV
jgi:hypothetical protein